MIFIATKGLDIFVAIKYNVDVAIKCISELWEVQRREEPPRNGLKSPGAGKGAGRTGATGKPGKKGEVFKMDNINLKDARQGSFPEVKEGKVEIRILSSVNYWHLGIEECPLRVRFWKEKIGESDSRSYRVTGSRTLALLKSGKLVFGDLVEVQYSPDGKEVVELVKCGHLYYEDELKEMGLWESPEGKKEV